MGAAPDGWVYYRCAKCGHMAAPTQIEPADDIEPLEECDCYKGPTRQRGVWRPAEGSQ
jgi:hypothetical protein